MILTEGRTENPGQACRVPLFSLKARRQTLPVMSRRALGVRALGVRASRKQKRNSWLQQKMGSRGVSKLQGIE